ncbi:MAG: membrane assembly protein AsmA [Bacteroidetes bacterium]|nr:membrane assembly protein AsmA [Bacteroidota bacterium]
METPKKKKSLLRRILKWTGITFLVLIIFIIAAPFLFKKQIVQFVKDTANEQLNAKVNFGEFDLTLISSFPDFTFTIDSVSVANIGEFEGDTLLYAKNLTLGLNLMSVIKGDEYKINTISIDQPRIHALVLKDGKANWDIAKPSTDTTATEDTTAAAPFKMTLKKLEIKNAYIMYDDAQADMSAELYNMNFNLSGDFTADNFLLETLTEIERLSVTSAGVAYFNKVKTRIKVDMDADMPNMKFVFKENEFAFNELSLGLDGFVALPKDDIDMDVKFKANQTEFKNILSLVPGVYTADFKDVKTSGQLALDGFAKGIYNETKMPAFGVKLLIKDAKFQYPSLPKSATNIQVDLLVDNKTGDMDATVVDLNKFHVELGGNPVDATMHLTTPISDANINAAVLAKINLASMKDVVPLEKGDDLNGMIAADVKMKGRMSAIEQEKYEEFHAEGSLTVTDMNYKTASLNYPTQINKLTLLFNPKTVDLSEFDAKVGKSDIQMQGKIENFLQYALQDSLLKGAFSFKSNFLDLNELMSSSDTTAPAAATPADTAAMTVAEVPSNLDVALNATIGKMLYDNMTITNVSGGVAIKDSKMSLDKLKLTIDELEGSMVLNGVYNTQNIKKPSVDFDVDIANFDIPKTFKMFNSVQKLAPIAQYAKGKFSTDLKFTTLLDETMSPVMNSLTGGGNLKTKNAVIEGFEPINKLADALNQPKYKKMSFENVDATYEFKDGRVYVKEMPIKSGNITGKVKGSTGFDQTIDYTWALEIPRSEFGSQANAAAGSLLSQLNQQAGTNIKMSDKVKIKAIFGGTVTKPTLKTDLFNTDQTPKEQVQNLVNQGVDMAKEKAREEAEKLMKDAQAEADKIKAEAKALADKTKAEGYDAIDKNIESIKNPLQKAAAKAAAPAAKKEVDKQAQKILDEANKKADQVLVNAKAEADKKLQ